MWVTLCGMAAPALALGSRSARCCFGLRALFSILQFTVPRLRLHGRWRAGEHPQQLVGFPVHPVNLPRKVLAAVSQAAYALEQSGQVVWHTKKLAQPAWFSSGYGLPESFSGESPIGSEALPSAFSSTSKLADSACWPGPCKRLRDLSTNWRVAAIIAFDSSMDFRTLASRASRSRGMGLIRIVAGRNVHESFETKETRVDSPMPETWEDEGAS